MFDLTADDVLTVYTLRKDKYPLMMTTTGTLNEGFTVDCPILVGKAHGQIIELYEDYGIFVLYVMDEAQTKGTHRHPYDVESAARAITEFMDGKSDYELATFPSLKQKE